MPCDPILRDFLDKLDADLAALPQGTRNDALSILSALRGPDSQKWEWLKDHTTCIIRTAALPIVFGKETKLTPLDVNLWGYTEVKLSEYDYHGHFATHIRSAAHALDLPIVVLP